MVIDVMPRATPVVGRDHFHRFEPDTGSRLREDLARGKRDRVPRTGNRDGFPLSHDEREVTLGVDVENGRTG